jgi:UTP-glucose-1-phosphate uridylyltransferase
MSPAPGTKALIPCGGKGTRMSALTGGAAKELLPIGGVPLVLHVLEECAASGISEVLIVSAPEKSDLEDDIPVMQMLLRRGRLTGCLIRGDFLDVGLPSGYVEADSRFGGGGKQQ